MGRFLYEARDGRGELSTGVISAPTIEEAGLLLRGEKKFVVRLAPARANQGAGARPARRARNGRGVKRNDVIFFVNQLAVMIETGVPLGEALQCLSRQSSNERFREVLTGVTEDVEAGNALSQSLAKYPRAFPPVMCALLRASEASGTMSTILDRIASYLMKEQQTVKQVRGALLYPAFMFLMCVSVTVFLMTFVLPRFAAIYANKGATLPGPTRVLLAASDGLMNYWAYCLGAVCALAVGVPMWFRTGVGRRQLDWLKLHVPVFSGIFSRLYLSRSCRTIGTMIDAGVSLLETILIAKDITRNSYYDELWDHADASLRKGKQLSEVMFASPVIPESVAQMVQSGEKSGRMGLVFSRLATFTEAEFDQAVKNATQFIEPVMIVVMGSLIGFVAIALLLPIFSAGRVMAGG